MADGNPKLASRRISPHSIGHQALPRASRLRRLWMKMVMPRNNARYTREMTVAQAAPSTPRAGSPRWPKINSQLATTLITLALTNAAMTGNARPIA